MSGGQFKWGTFLKAIDVDSVNCGGTQNLLQKVLGKFHYMLEHPWDYSVPSTIFVFNFSVKMVLGENPRVMPHNISVCGWRTISREEQRRRTMRYKILYRELSRTGTKHLVRIDREEVTTKIL